MLTTTSDVGYVHRARGVQITKPISGVQHTQAFCKLFRSFSACAECQLACQGPSTGPMWLRISRNYLINPF